MSSSQTIRFRTNRLNIWSISRHEPRLPSTFRTGDSWQCDAKQYLGSRDKRDPIESKPIPLNFELYFAGRSNTWPRREKDSDVPGGIALVRQNPERGPTLGKMYLITDEQFNDVVLQENDKTPDGNRYVPVFEQLVSQRELPLDGDPLYGKILNIGSEEARPILTFTTGRRLTLNEPSETTYRKSRSWGVRTSAWRSEASKPGRAKPIYPQSPSLLRGVGEAG